MAVSQSPVGYSKNGFGSRWPMAWKIKRENPQIGDYSAISYTTGKPPLIPVPHRLERPNIQGRAKNGRLDVQAHARSGRLRVALFLGTQSWPRPPIQLPVDRARGHDHVR